MKVAAGHPQKAKARERGKKRKIDIGNIHPPLKNVLNSMPTINKGTRKRRKRTTKTKINKKNTANKSKGPGKEADKSENKRKIYHREVPVPGKLNKPKKKK